ncbi:MAG: YncE family protein, partial [Vicinamibacterales bacterium]
MRLTSLAPVCSRYALLTLSAALLFAACDGPNRFQTAVPGGSATGPGQDTRLPKVDVQVPRGDSLSAKPLRDSVLVRVHVSDNVGVDSVLFSGIVERGVKELGTDTVVARFTPKKIVLPPNTKDTTLTRYLQPLDTLRKETAKIIVAAYDASGNVAADTSKLVLGGPDIALQNITAGQSIQAGLGLSLRVVARDPQGVIQIQINFAGAFTRQVVKQVVPPSDSIVFDTTVVVPAGVSGALQISAVARNALDVSGQDGPIAVNVVSATAGDTIRPRILAVSTSTERLELKDSITVTITGSDNTQGSGLRTAGYTVLAIAPSRGDTLVRSGLRTFNPPRTGTVTEAFKAGVFNVDSLNLPDTLVFEVTGYLVDAQGNCAASVGGEDLVSLPCDTLPTGQVIARGRTGQRLTRTIVAGRTVNLPNGGRIMDAVIDTTRRNLYLSNQVRDRVEVFRLQTERFLPPVPVGSEPWGLSLNRAHDTLIVANSGGTNLTNVYLGPASGVGPFSEDAQRRLLTPNVNLFEIERQTDEAGRLKYIKHFYSDGGLPGFSGRPQFMAVDSTGRIVFSTRTTLAGNNGTLRKAFVPAGGQTEVKMFIEHAALVPNADFVALGHIDDVDVVATDSADNVIIYDHRPGFPNTAVTGGPDLVAQAAADAATAGSDVVWGTGRFNVPALGFRDTTFVSASGDGGWVVIGEGAQSPIGRVIMYEASRDRISRVIQVADLFVNASETVKGIGLNYDGTLGVARGTNAYFYTTDLRLQGVAGVASGGAGAVLHPLHANSKSLTNTAGVYRPDTHIAFVGTGERTIDIYDT